MFQYCHDHENFPLCSCWLLTLFSDLYSLPWFTAIWITWRVRDHTQFWFTLSARLLVPLTSWPHYGDSVMSCGECFAWKQRFPKISSKTFFLFEVFFTERSQYMLSHIRVLVHFLLSEDCTDNFLCFRNT